MDNNNGNVYDNVQELNSLAHSLRRNLRTLRMAVFGQEPEQIKDAGKTPARDSMVGQLREAIDDLQVASKELQMVNSTIVPTSGAQSPIADLRR